MLLPLFFKTLGLKKGLVFNTLVILGVLVTLIPFYDPLFATHYSNTLSLWFSNFEFNASIYNVIKSLGTQLDLKPWEFIKTYGKIIPIIVIAWVGLLTYFRKNQQVETLITSMLMIITVYLFFSTTVHPWYIISLVLLCLFSEFRFPLVWSATVILSYSAYSNPEFKETMLWLFIEYLAVIGFLVYELFKRQGLKSLIPKN